MSSAAILGAGPIGSAIAQRLAERARVSEIRFVDENPQVAAGKALDIRQSGPIGRYDTAISASGDPLSAVGADVVVIADDTASGEWDGERGLALLQRLERAGASAPLVFAAPAQLWLMEAAARELHITPDRLIGTAASAVAGAVAALVHVELGETGAQVSVTGRPPMLVVGWSAATIAGALLTDRIPSHRLLAISGSLPRFWPPGPQAIAAPTALIVEALIAGSRRLLPALTILEGEFSARGSACLMPVELGRGRVLRRVMPSLSPQERTETMNSITRRT